MNRDAGSKAKATVMKATHKMSSDGGSQAEGVGEKEDVVVKV